MDESMTNIMEVREDFMVSPIGDSKPYLRTAYFLKPLAKSLDGAVSGVLSSSVSMPLPSVFEPKVWPLVIHSIGWRCPMKKWVEWVDALQVKYESLWKKVGIFEAIKSTKCSIVNHQNLCYGVAEKWCPETNTFLFPWGEATITLEDVMVLGGYPIVGDPIFTPLQSQEMREVEKKLIHARQEPWRRKKGKASLSAWIDLFVNSGSEIEHEAFLATWLTMVGFSTNGLVSRFVFPIAIHLARGNPVALGPAVLASIYTDLSLLKKAIVGVTGDNLESEVTLKSPFYLVQIWVWERFKNLQPQPRLVGFKDPVLFRWHKLFYPENETLVPFETDLDTEQISFVTCMRVSALVGIESTIKQYLPHRVAMQFGMDQDVPDCVPGFYGTEAITWKNYCRPISCRSLYFPARLFEGDVTTRYAKWWKQSVLSYQDFAKNIVHQERNPRPHLPKANTNGNDADVPPGFPPKLVRTVYFGKSGGDDSNARKGNIDDDVPTKILSKQCTPTPCISDEKFKHVLEENKCGDMAQSSVKGKTYQCRSLSNASSSSATAYYENVKRISPLTKLVVNDVIEPLMGGMEEDFEDANGSNESWMSSEGVSLSGPQGESYSCASGTKVMDLEQRINRLETVIKKLKIAKFGHC
uniref:Serine/threonine protein phosphatase 7 long form isogeny n=1 Tax=Cajanus cajan TaxID=3821 RepID=A0A151T1N2_CAJCA|nr:Serine/threonine protein phosphatase 7 long form isogeny [Cajanus cajan]